MDRFCHFSRHYYDKWITRSLSLNSLHSHQTSQYQLSLHGEAVERAHQLWIHHRFILPVYDWLGFSHAIRPLFLLLVFLCPQQNHVDIYYYNGLAIPSQSAVLR